MSKVNRPDIGDVDGAIAYARQCLQQQLAPELTYHNLAHTFKHVLPAAMDLADQCDVTPEEKDLLAVAVAFHDIGWIVQGPGHERIGAKLAREMLPPFGFTDRQIERIMALILATQMPHQPNSLLERILVDADMAILSHDDFWQCNDELRAEMAVLGKPMSDREWYESQLAFLEAHRYFTPVAVARRERVKQQHMLELRRRLQACLAQPGPSLNGHAKAGSLIESERNA